jgi:molecular chaperone HscC
MIVGIDLGTTNSAVAYLAEDGPRLIPNALGEVLTPSVVGVDADGRLSVGRAAKELQVTQPERCAGNFKRRMGSDWQAELAGRKFSAEELSGLVLRAPRKTRRGFSRSRSSARSSPCRPISTTSSVRPPSPPAASPG